LKNLHQEKKDLQQVEKDLKNLHQEKKDQALVDLLKTIQWQESSVISREDSSKETSQLLMPELGSKVNP
jgi:CRISPR/Cas system-associated endoribonuclease Cas2